MIFGMLAGGYLTGTYILGAHLFGAGQGRGWGSAVMFLLSPVTVPLGLGWMCFMALAAFTSK